MRILDYTKQNLFLITIVMVGAFLRFYHLDFQSVWLDEIYTLNETNPSKTVPEILNNILVGTDVHPPLHYLLTHLAFSLFGYTTFVLRAVSATIGLAGIIAIYHFGKEIFNKEVGLFASALLAVNYFHLFHSQDGRMYSLLFLVTTISFIFLIRFIKEPTVKTALLYGSFSTLMIYSHFFALFALCSQYFILLYFVARPFNVERKKFFLYCFVAGLLILILYIPTYSLLLKVSKTTSFWIQMPSLDVYTSFFKEFFGQSEIVLFFISVLLLVFFFQLFNEKNNTNNSVNPNEDKLVFSFIMIFGWVLVTLILPLIRTYTSVPMLVNRYFINILPAILTIIAIALFYIKNKTIRYSILSIIIIFSLTDIVVVKNYYNRVTKTQFREVSCHIANYNKDSLPVVSSWGWFYSYFLNNDKLKTEIIGKTLDAYVDEMIQDPTKKTNFWYTDGHGTPYKASEKTQKFLDDNFVVKDDVNLWDCWAKLYVKK